MNERIQESLSALLDGAADELEVRRLLKHCEHSEQLYHSWERYQQIGQIMRQEPVMSLDIAARVRQALDEEAQGESSSFAAADEPAAAMVAQPIANSWSRRFLSGAVAASVMFAVLVAVQWQATGSLENEPAQAGLVAENSVVTEKVLTENENLALKDAQQRLQQYVLEHNDQAYEYSQSGLLPLMQNANYQPRSAR